MACHFLVWSWQLSAFGARDTLLHLASARRRRIPDACRNVSLRKRKRTLGSLPADPTSVRLSQRFGRGHPAGPGSGSVIDVALDGAQGLFVRQGLPSYRPRVASLTDLRAASEPQRRRLVEASFQPAPCACCRPAAASIFSGRQRQLVCLNSGSAASRSARSRGCRQRPVGKNTRSDPGRGAGRRGREGASTRGGRLHALVGSGGEEARQGGKSDGR